MSYLSIKTQFISCTFCQYNYQSISILTTFIHKLLIFYSYFTHKFVIKDLIFLNNRKYFKCKNCNILNTARCFNLNSASFCQLDLPDTSLSILLGVVIRISLVWFIVTDCRDVIRKQKSMRLNKI